MIILKIPAIFLSRLKTNSVYYLYKINYRYPRNRCQTLYPLNTRTLAWPCRCRAIITTKCQFNLINRSRFKSSTSSQSKIANTQKNNCFSTLMGICFYIFLNKFYVFLNFSDNLFGQMSAGFCVNQVFNKLICWNVVIVDYHRKNRHSLHIRWNHLVCINISMLSQVSTVISMKILCQVHSSRIIL